MMDSLRQIELSTESASSITSTTAFVDRPQYSSNLEKKTLEPYRQLSEYESRQQEYEKLLKPELPNTDVNFKEEINDQVIKNMDELLEQQRKMREMDLVVSEGVARANRQPSSQIPKKIRFLDDLQEPIEHIEIPNSNKDFDELKTTLKKIQTDIEYLCQFLVGSPPYRKINNDNSKFLEENLEENTDEEIFEKNF